MTEVPSSGRQSPGQERYDDEISLIDLTLVLIRRKWLITGIFIVCASLGLSYALLMQGDPVYRYSTVIELAHLDDGKPIESSETVRDLLMETFIPLAKDQLRSQYEDVSDVEVEVIIPDGSDRLLQISSNGTIDSLEAISSVHHFLIENVKNELDGPMSREKEVLVLERESITDELERLQVEKQRIIERIDNAQQRLETGRLLFNKAPLEATDEVRAMTLLIIQSQIEEAHAQLINLEDQLYNTIPDRENRLNKDLTSINNRLESIMPTKARMITRQSDKPVGGSSNKLILALSVVLGVMLGIFGAFFAEFLAKAKIAAREQ